MKNIKKKSQINLIWHINDLPIKFPSKIRDTYEKIYLKNRKIYTNWVDKNGKKFSDDIDWWMTSPSFRNPYVSRLLNYFSVIDTLKTFKNENIKIFTDSEVFGEIIKNKLGNVNVEINLKKNSRGLLAKLKNYFKSTIYQLIIFSFIKIFKKKEDISNKKLVLIDKFVTLNQSQNLGYYPKFLNIKKIRIVPTFIPTLNLFKLIKIFYYLKNNDQKFLYKEQYLKLNDLYFSFTHIFRRKKFLNQKFFYNKINVSNLIHDELESYIDFFSINNGLLNYKFFYRLSKEKVNIFKSFNWFENQIIDKGWNLGFRKYFSKNEQNSYGYQDFNKHFNLISNSPSILEKTSKVIPNRIIIISNYFKKITNEFTKKQKIIIAQSERFKKLTRAKVSPLKKRDKILIILSGIRNIDRALIDLIKTVCLRNKKIIAFVKPHPILNIDQIITKKSLPTNLIVCEEDLIKILNKSFITITAGPSSALLESVSFRTYNILPEIECGTDMNAKIFSLKKHEYSLVRNSNELLRAINYIKKNKKNIKIFKRVIINSKSKKLDNFIN